MKTPALAVVVDNHEAMLDGVVAIAACRPESVRIDRCVADVTELDLDGDIAPDVVVLDLYLGRDDVVSTPWIPRLRDWGAAVLLHTTCESPVPLREALAAGAQGLCLKNDGVEALADAIVRVAAGEFACSSALARALLLDDTLIATLTPREVDVIQAIDDGLSHQEAAHRLDVAESTIGDHLKSIRQRYLDLDRGEGNAHSLAKEARHDGWI